MSKDELAKMAKLRIRKSTDDDLDLDVGQLIAVALTDLKRIGVNESYLGDEISDPLIIEAVLLYTKANF